MSRLAPELPAGVRRTTVADLAALTAGDGPTALLVPGFTGSKEDFLPVLAPLAERGFRVVAIDQRGQYESPGGEDPAEYTLPVLAADLVRVVADLGGGPVHLVGHSFGGLVARAAVLDDGLPTTSLTLLDSGPSALTGTRRRALDAAERVLAAYGKENVWAAMERETNEPPAVLAFLRDRFFTTRTHQLTGVAAILRTEPDRVDELAAHAAATGLPLLVAYGADDDAWPAPRQTEMAVRLGAGNAPIAGAAHSPAVEAPAATAAVLGDFWAHAAALAELA